MLEINGGLIASIDSPPHSPSPPHSIFYQLANPANKNLHPPLRHFSGR